MIPFLLSPGFWLLCSLTCLFLFWLEVRRACRAAARFIRWGTLRRRFAREQHLRITQRLLRGEWCLTEEEPLPRRGRTYPLARVLAEAFADEQEGHDGDDEENTSESVGF